MINTPTLTSTTSPSLSLTTTLNFDQRANSGADRCALFKPTSGSLSWDGHELCHRDGYMHQRVSKKKLVIVRASVNIAWTALISIYHGCVAIRMFVSTLNPDQGSRYKLSIYTHELFVAVLEVIIATSVNAAYVAHVDIFDSAYRGTNAACKTFDDPIPLDCVPIDVVCPTKDNATNPRPDVTLAVFREFFCTGIINGVLWFFVDIGIEKLAANSLDRPIMGEVSLAVFQAACEIIDAHQAYAEAGNTYNDNWCAASGRATHESSLYLCSNAAPHNYGGKNICNRDVYDHSQYQYSITAESIGLINDFFWALNPIIVIGFCRGQYIDVVIQSWLSDDDRVPAPGNAGILGGTVIRVTPEGNAALAAYETCIEYTQLPVRVVISAVQIAAAVSNIVGIYESASYYDNCCELEWGV